MKLKVLYYRLLDFVETKIFRKKYYSFSGWCNEEVDDFSQRTNISE